MTETGYPRSLSAKVKQSNIRRGVPIATVAPIDFAYFDNAETRAEAYY